MKTVAETYFAEYQERFSSLTDEELVALFNREVGQGGWGSARGCYLAAIHEEFDRRGWDYREIGDQKSLSFAKKIFLEGRSVRIGGKPSV